MENFSATAEILRDLDRKIAATRNQLREDLKFLARLTKEMETKVAVFDIDDNSFSEDLNLASAGAKVQAGSTALAALVGTKATVTEVAKFEALTAERRAAEAVELTAGLLFTMNDQQFKVESGRVSKAGEIWVSDNIGTKYRMPALEVKKALVTKQ